MTTDQFNPHKFKTEIKTTYAPPMIWVPILIAAKMQLLLEWGESNEVSWLGDVHRTESNDFVLQDIYLLRQKVTGGSASLTSAGQEEFVSKLIKELGIEGFTERYNFKLWGHSHPSFSTTPSAQDDTQMDEFENTKVPYFIRLIINKKGKMSFTFFDYENGTTVDDMEWQYIYPTLSEEEEKALKAQFDELVTEKVFTTTYPSMHKSGNQQTFWEKTRKGNKSRLEKPIRFSMGGEHFYNIKCQDGISRNFRERDDGSPYEYSIETDEYKSTDFGGFDERGYDMYGLKAVSYTDYTSGFNSKSTFSPYMHPRTASFCAKVARYMLQMEELDRQEQDFDDDGVWTGGCEK